MGILEDVLNQPAPESLGKINGMDVYTFADEAKASDRRNIEEKLGGKVELGQREVRDGGLSYASSRIRSVAINPIKYYLNRYRVITKEIDGTQEKVYQVVSSVFGPDDYRLITEQETGHTFIASIVVHEIGKGKKKDGLRFIGKEHVTEKEFINEFKGELTQKAMNDILYVVKNTELSEEADKDDIIF